LDLERLVEAADTKGSATARKWEALGQPMESGDPGGEEGAGGSTARAFFREADKKRQAEAGLVCDLESWLNHGKSEVDDKYRSNYAAGGRAEKPPPELPPPPALETAMPQDRGQIIKLLLSPSAGAPEGMSSSSPDRGGGEGGGDSSEDDDLKFFLDLQEKSLGNTDRSAAAAVAASAAVSVAAGKSQGRSSSVSKTDSTAARKGEVHGTASDGPLHPAHGQSQTSSARLWTNAVSGKQFWGEYVSTARVAGATPTSPKREQVTISAIQLHGQQRQLFDLPTFSLVLLDRQYIAAVKALQLARTVHHQAEVTPTRPLLVAGGDTACYSI
jgi:hypothetical protein